MAYEKTEWKNGDTITAEKLNHMEDGIAEDSGALVLHSIEEGTRATLDKTFGEIWEAYRAGKSIIYLKEMPDINYYEGCKLENIYYTVGGNSQGEITLGLTQYFVSLEDSEPKTIEALFAKYPYTNFD